MRGAATLSAGANGARVLKDLSVSVGLSRVAGDLTLGADGLLAGSVTVISPDLSKVAPLFLVDARGMLHGELRLSSEGGAQSAEFSGTATDIVYENVSLDSADIKGTARDLFRAPLIDGDFLLHNMRAGGLTIVSATGTAARQGTSTLMSIDAKLADGSAKMQGSFGPSSTGVAIALQSFTYKRPGVDLALASPTTIAVAGGSARFNQTTLKTGGGSVVLSGQVGANIDLTATLNAVPVALANSFKPDLGAEGTVSGTVTAKGAAADPSATFKIVFASASVTASRNAGLGPLAISADGTLAGKTLNLRSHTSGAGNLSIDGRGNDWHSVRRAAQPEDRGHRAPRVGQRAARRSRRRAAGRPEARRRCLRHGCRTEILRPRHLRGRRLCRSGNRDRAERPAACRDCLGRPHRH